MKILFKIFAVAVLCSVLSGCASIVSKSNWPLTVVTNPEGVKIEISNRDGLVIYSGLTPASLTLKSGSTFFMKESYRVKMSFDGFSDRIIPLECNLNGWYFGNILFGGLIGILIVDPATGAMYRLERGYIFESFEKPMANSQDPSLKILDINKIPEEMKKSLVALK